MNGIGKRKMIHALLITIFLLKENFWIANAKEWYDDLDDDSLRQSSNITERQLQLSTVLACDENSGQVAGYACKNVGLQARLPLYALGAIGPVENMGASDIWGWTDPDTGREYAIVGLYQGVAFVDISNPQLPKLIAKLPATVEGSFAKDVKNYGRFAYVVSETEGHGIQIFDMSQLPKIRNPPVYVRPTAFFAFSGSFPNGPKKKSNEIAKRKNSSDALNRRLGQGRDDDYHQDYDEEEKNPDSHPSWWTEGGDAHNIAINEASGYAYLVGTNKCNGGLYILELLSNPLRPTFAGCFGDTGYIHDAQCIIYNGPDFTYTGREICFASNGKNGLSIIDVTNKAGPLLISRIEKSYFEFISQGWVTEQRNFFIMGDEGRKGLTKTYIVDISNLDSPKINGIHTSTIEAQAHNMFVRGQYIYQANYRGGLRILNLLEIYGEESEAGYFDVYQADDKYGYQGAFGVYPFFRSGNVIISSVEDGLFIVQPIWLTPAPTLPPVLPPTQPEAAGGCCFFKSLMVKALVTRIIEDAVV